MPSVAYFSQLSSWAIPVKAGWAEMQKRGRLGLKDGIYFSAKVSKAQVAKPLPIRLGEPRHIWTGEIRCFSSISGGAAYTNKRLRGGAFPCFQNRGSNGGPKKESMRASRCSDEFSPNHDTSGCNRWHVESSLSHFLGPKRGSRGRQRPRQIRSGQIGQQGACARGSQPA